MLHPNQEAAEEEEEEDEQEKGCSHYFKVLDQQVLKPLLIYKYNYAQMHQQDDLLEHIKENKDALLNTYKELLKKQEDNQTMDMNERITQTVVQLTTEIGEKKA